MSVHTVYQERDDGPPFAPEFELIVDFDVERDCILIEDVRVKFAGGRQTAALGPSNYDRGAIEELCRDHLRTMQ